MDKKRLWKQTQTELQLALSKPHYQLFFSNTSLANITVKDGHSECNLVVPNTYIKEGVSRKYQTQVEKIISRLTQTKTKIKLSVRPQITTGPLNFGPLFTAEKDNQQKQKKINTMLRQARLQPAFSFDNFAVSSSNEMAYAAAKAVVREPGKAYNPLFFYGGVGVGKTHLMQGVAQEALKKNELLKVLYCTGEEFTNEIIDAIQGKKTSFFRRKFRSVPLLLIDDIQFIAGKNTVQEEFFHTFNAILQEGGQIILTSDRPPSEIQKLEERLASRFEAGLIVDIQEPNFELRTAILLIKAKALNLKIPMDVAQIVAAKIKSTRQLEGALTKIKAFIQNQPNPLTPDLVAEMLRLNHSKNQAFKKANPREVIAQVAHHFNLKTSQLKGKERHQFIVLPRQIAMFLLRVDSKYPLVEVGTFFGGRDHTTVMHAVEKIKNLLSVSEEIRFNVGLLRKSLS